MADCGEIVCTTSPLPHLRPRDLIQVLVKGEKTCFFRHSVLGVPPPEEKDTLLHITLTLTLTPHAVRVHQGTERVKGAREGPRDTLTWL